MYLGVIKVILYGWLYLLRIKTVYQTQVGYRKMPIVLALSGDLWIFIDRRFLCGIVEKNTMAITPWGIALAVCRASAGKWWCSNIDNPINELTMALLCQHLLSDCTVDDREKRHIMETKQTSLPCGGHQSQRA